MCRETEVEKMESTLKVTSGVRSTLNADAPVFVPAAYRAPEDFSSEWWTLMETDAAFRKVWMNASCAGSDEQVQFEEDFEELADLKEFLEYQDQLHQEEAAQQLLDVDFEDDVFCDEEIDLVNANACKELTKVQKPQTQWSKQSKNHEKFPNNYGNLPRKGHTYRIQQPRTVM